MKLNNEYVVKELKSKINKSEEEILKICNIMDNHFIIGKKNKERIINDIMNDLGYSYDDADSVYNVFIDIVLNGIKKSVTHPFGKNK